MTRFLHRAAAWALAAGLTVPTPPARGLPTISKGTAASVVARQTLALWSGRIPGPADGRVAREMDRGRGHEPSPSIHETNGRVTVGIKAKRENLSVGGSGFIIRSDAQWIYIQTAYHTLRQTYERTVLLPDPAQPFRMNQSVAAEWIASDEKEDLALIRIPRASWTTGPVPHVVFSPLSLNLAVNAVVEGIVAFIGFVHFEQQFLMVREALSTPLWVDADGELNSMRVMPGGSSGAPIINQDGLVIGMIKTGRFQASAQAILRFLSSVDPLPVRPMINTASLDVNRLGDYTLEHVLGSGANGTVYKAHLTNQPDGPRVAIKIAGSHDQRQSGESPKRHSLELIQVEIAVMERLKGLEPAHQKHFDEFIASFIDPISGPVLVMVMDHESPPLSHFLDWEEFRFEERIRKGIQILEALDILNPTNIVGDAILKLRDFAYARSTPDAGDHPLPHAVQRGGNKKYSSPEQLHGGQPLTVASDLYSVGIILKDFQRARDIHSIPILEAFDTIITRATQRDPRRRYQSASEMIRALTELHSALARAA